MKKTFMFTLMLVFVISVGMTFGAEKPVKMRFGYLGGEGAEDDLCAKEFKRYLEQKTNGRIEVLLYPNEQLGKEVDMVTSQELDLLEMAIYGFTLYAQAAPEYNIWSAYYLFNDVDEQLELVKGPIGNQVKAAVLKNKGIRIIGFGPRGPRHLTSNRPIKTAAEVKGLKIRVPLQPIYVESWKALGALPTPIAFAELYTAIKQGIVEAQENPLALIHSAHFYEVQKYCNLTAHQMPFFTYAVSDKFFLRLEPDLQTAVLEAGEYITGYHKQLQQEKEGEWFEKLKEAGMTFVETDRESVRKAMSHIPEQFKDKWVPNLYEDIQQQLTKIRAK